jgi:acetyl-CoA synthetase
MLPFGRTYEDVTAAFRWRIPPAYNMAVDACEKWAATEPERVALIHVRADGAVDRWSYGRMSRTAHRLANLLVARGVRRGDRVAILLPQSPETAIAHIAIYAMAAVALPLADLFGVEALSYRLADAGARVVVTNRTGAAKIAEIRDQLPELELVLTVDGAAEGTEDFHLLLAAASDRFETVTTSADDRR